MCLQAPENPEHANPDQRVCHIMSTGAILLADVRNKKCKHFTYLQIITFLSEFLTFP